MELGGWTRATPDKAGVGAASARPTAGKPFGLTTEMGNLARDAGFEPTTLGFGAGFEALGDDGKSSHTLSFQALHDGSVSTDSHRFAPASTTLVSAVSQETPAKRRRLAPVAADVFLTVRDVAALLKVSTATVYKLCDHGELPHARVLNSIRLTRASVDAYLARDATPQPKAPE